MPDEFVAGRDAVPGEASPGRSWLGDVPPPPPPLGALPHESMAWLIATGLPTVLADCPPIVDLARDAYRVAFTGCRLGPPPADPDACRAARRTYGAPLVFRAALTDLATGAIAEQDLDAGLLPLPLPDGTFLIRGGARIVISQLARAPGAYFAARVDPTTGRRDFGVTLLPARGPRLRLQLRRGTVEAWFDRRGPLPVTALLRVLGATTADLAALCADLDPLARAAGDPAPRDGAPGPLAATLAADPATDEATAAAALFGILRARDLARPDAIAAELRDLFANAGRYRLGAVGRAQLRHAVDSPATGPLLARADVEALLRALLARQGAQGPDDDGDDLARRHLRPVGAQLADRCADALVRVARLARERLERWPVGGRPPRPVDVVPLGPVHTCWRRAFAANPLAQLAAQTNPLAHLTHLRRASVLGPGGLDRGHRDLAVRDVHPSSFGRLCPLETPEGPNLGLIAHLALEATVDADGFILAPACPIRRAANPADDDACADLAGATLAAPVRGPAGEILAPTGATIGPGDPARWRGAGVATVALLPQVRARAVALDARASAALAIGPADLPRDAAGTLDPAALVEARAGGAIRPYVPTTALGAVDRSPRQVLGVAANLIPFIAHDDSNRALMGCAMQRQAVPLLRPAAPMVGTGLEAAVARDSGWGVVAEAAGTVVAVDGTRVLVRPDPPVPGGPAPAPRAYPLRPPGRSPQGTSRRQRPLVARGARVAPGDLLAEGSAMAGGELALGQNLVVAFLPFEGGNYEDAIVVGERVVREGLLTSDHLAEYRCPVRRTALGGEWVTPLVPGVRPARLAHLDGAGLVRVGQRVGPGDYLVGKAIPLPDDAATPAERLAHAILAPDGAAPRARDGSLLLPHGTHGVVVAVERLDAAGADLPPEVVEEIRVVVATRRPIEPGDKLAGRHGNKGTISRIVPTGDMPFLPDGTPVDVILNPLGVPSRMNLGQLFETALGLVAHATGARYAVPAYAGPGRDALRALLVAHGLPPDGKAVLRDGRTGEPFAQRVVVGVMYLLKLDHLAAKKAHARATGPYAALSGQPVGGKARFGGQRLGEMEVWALEAYGATDLVSELLTLRSDDADGRLALHRHLTGAGPAPVAGGPTASLRRFRETVAALGVRVTPGPGAGGEGDGPATG